MDERREYKDELTDAPELKKLGKKGPFQVPDTYFEELEARIDDEVWKEDPQSQLIDQAGKASVFKTPENYFEGVLTEFEKRKRKEAKVHPLRARRIPFYLVAGIAAAIMLLLLFIKPDIFPSDSVEVEFAGVEALSMEDLLAEVKPEELSEDIILATFDPEVLEEWIDEESPDILIESEEEDMDGLIEALDVYSLEEELDNLN